MEPKTAVHASDSLNSNGNYSNGEKLKRKSVFEACYDDWAAFDAAVAHAMTQHHPLRKRSSLTFDVYNRTVSKGRHDRKVIAEFLSKTYKCTHGIKFRARGHGKRMRHKLRDIGCPFHVYASAVEFGETYRVKVRVHDEHNHPIGPHAMTSIAALHSDTEYEFMKEPASESRPALGVDTAPPQANGLEFPGHQSIVQAQVRAQELLQAQAQALVQAHRQSRMPMNLPGSDNRESLPEHSNGAVSSSTSSKPQPSRKRKASFRFEDSATTFEGLRHQLSAFAQDRDWDQFHTPRNLLLALTGETSELCECFQWKDESVPIEEWTSEEKEHLGEELSEIAMYLIRLADKCQVDLPAAIKAKMSKNASKYRVEQVKAARPSTSNEAKRPGLDKEREMRDEFAHEDG